MIPEKLREIPKKWRHQMKVTKLTLPELALIAGTRAALGAGAALLLAIFSLRKNARQLAGLSSSSEW